MVFLADIFFLSVKVLFYGSWYVSECFTRGNGWKWEGKNSERGVTVIRSLSPPPDAAATTRP